MTLSWQNQMLSMLEVAKLQLENSMHQLVSAPPCHKTWRSKVLTLMVKANYEWQIKNNARLAEQAKEAPYE